MNVTQLRKEECVIGGTTFYFSQMSPMIGIRIAEKIKHEFNEVTTTDTFMSIFGLIKKEGVDSDDLQGVSLTKALMSLRPVFVEKLMVTMFTYVQYQNEKTTRQTLEGSEDQAFNELGIMAIYKVLAQSLVVNFYDFFTELLSLLFQRAEEEAVEGNEAIGL